MTLRERVTKETRLVKECLMDPSPGQYISTQHAICEELFDEKQHSSDATSTIFVGPNTVRLLSLSKSQVYAQRTQVRVHGCNERKSDATLEHHNTR